MCSIKRPQFEGSPHTRVGGPTVTIKLGDAEYVLPTRVGVDRYVVGAPLKLLVLPTRVGVDRGTNW